MNEGRNSYKPRSIFVDLDPMPISKLKSKQFKNFFDHEYLISGYEDANNYARGYYTTGLDVIDLTMQRIRMAVESCECLDSIVLHHSIGGGTGSGL
jgi:tubulin alpha